MNKNQLANISKNYTIGIAILPAAAGSVVTFMFVFAALAGAIDVIRKRVSFGLNKYDRIIVYPAFSFFIINALSTVRPDFKIEDLNSLVPALLFLLPYFFIKRYRYAGQGSQFAIFLRAVPFGAFLLLPWLLYDIINPGPRTTGGAGNAIPFGMICALMMPICLMNLSSTKKSSQVLALVGFSIFTVGLTLSQTRIMYIAVIPNILIALGYVFYVSRRKLRVLLLSAIFLVFAGTAFWNSSIVQERFSLLINPVVALLNGAEITDESLGHRVLLFKKGLCFAQNQTLIGYGISNRREVLLSEDVQAESYFKFCEQSHGVFYYSHFHNGFITAFIDAGIFGLIATISMLLAPLTLAVLSPSDGIKPQRIAIALCLTSVYGVSGLTNLLFGHDLIDVIFIIFAVFLALSIGEDVNKATKS